MNNTNFFPEARRSVIFVFLLLHCFYALADDYIFVPKYGYGNIDWGRKRTKFNEPEIYPLRESNAFHRVLSKNPEATTRDIYPFYSISESENKVAQAAYKIDEVLSVQQNNDDVIAILTFHNKSNQDYFIHKEYLPSRYPGFSEICGGAFKIITKNIKLDYLGRYCEFESNYNKDTWLIIKKGENISFKIVLNNAYEFLPGKYTYNIGTLEYSLVTESWFIEKNIYRTMFSIFEKRIPCPINTGRPLVTEFRWLCPQYSNGNENGLKYFLELKGIDESKNKNYFEIRSNQVSVTINSNSKMSYYKMIDRK